MTHCSTQENETGSVRILGFRSTAFLVTSTEDSLDTLPKQRPVTALPYPHELASKALILNNPSQPPLSFLRVSHQVNLVQ